MADKSKCDVDTSKCPAMELDDIWWEHYFKEDTDFFVIPTVKYQFLPEDQYEGALHLSPKVKGLREKYYRKWGFQK